MQEKVTQKTIALIFRFCFLYWLIAGSFGISGSFDVLALNCIIGDLISGVVLIVKIIGMAGEPISIVTRHFWTKSPKVEI